MSLVLSVFLQYMQSWVPEENPCLICMCLDQQRINCTDRPCNDVRSQKPETLLLLLIMLFASGFVVLLKKKKNCHLFEINHVYLFVAPVCGPCEVLRKKTESKCCPEYECGM